MKLTRARLGALVVLEQGRARYGNHTCIERIQGDVTLRTVYWQCADWLISEGYARSISFDGAEGVEITAAGQEALRVERTGATR